MWWLKHAGMVGSGSSGGAGPAEPGEAGLAHPRVSISPLKRPRRPPAQERCRGALHRSPRRLEDVTGGSPHRVWVICGEPSDIRVVRKHKLGLRNRATRPSGRFTSHRRHLDRGGSPRPRANNSYHGRPGQQEPWRAGSTRRSRSSGMSSPSLSRGLKCPRPLRQTRAASRLAAVIARQRPCLPQREPRSGSTTSVGADPAPGGPAPSSSTRSPAQDW